MYQIASVFQGMPIVFLRYNPDGYKDADGAKAKMPPKRRHDILIRWVKQCLRKKWDKGIHVKYLFYDGYQESDGTVMTLSDLDIIG